MVIYEISGVINPLLSTSTLIFAIRKLEKLLISDF